MLNGLINTAIVGSSIKDGVKKAKQAFKPSTNVHDEILNNKPVVIPPESITNKSASDTIDALFEKLSYEVVDEDTGNEGKELKQHTLLPKALAAAILAAGVSSAISHRDPFAPFIQMKDAVKSVPEIVGDKFLFKGRAGKALKKAFSKAKDMSKNKAPGEANLSNFAKGLQGESKKTVAEKDRFLKGLVLGAGIGAGNLGVHMLGDKYFENKNTVQKSYDSMPEPVSEIYHARKKDKYTDNRRKHSSSYNNRTLYKTSEIIDEAYEKLASTPTFTGGKHFFKKVLKEDVAQNALRSLPYFAVPAAASYATGRDLRYDARKVNKGGNDKIVIDVPISDFKKKKMEKKAGIGKLFKKKPPVHESMPWKHFFKYEMPAATARSLSFALPATALTAMSGRNIRGSGEKINQADRKPVEPGKARITIETGHHHKTPEMDSKSATESIESLFKTAIAVNVKKKRKIDIRTRVKQFMERNRLNLMTNSDILKNIVRGAMEQKTVNITYVDAKGLTSTRETEPYEMRDNKYWGYCKDKNSIRQFKMENVTSATVTENKYSPRWEVKIK